MSFVIKGIKGLEPGERKIETLVIGSRSTIPLPLDDSMVAPKHCAIHEVADGYELEDLNSSTGTYLNGVVVQGRQKIPTDGGTIIVGHSRIKVEIDAESGALQLSVKEGSFFYDKKNDPLRWVRAEVSLGRYPTLRLGIYAALILTLVAFLYVAFASGADDLMQPGAMISVHTEAMRKAVRENRLTDGCAACHEPWGAVSVALCDTCHETKMADGTRYPFWTAAQWTKKGRACQDCHLEHQGDDPKRLYPEDFRGLWGSPEVGTRPSGQDTAPSASDEVRLTFNTFSHQQHLAEKLACTECHRTGARSEPVRVGSERREFARVTFESCMRCHDPSVDRSLAKTRFYVSWHGSDQPDSRCTTCHEKNHAGPLKRTVREASPVPGRAYVYRSNHHTGVIEKLTADSKVHPCKACHQDGRVGGAQRGGLFRHYTHLSGLTDRHNQQCIDCHAEVTSAERLAQTRPATPPDESCKQCHETSVPKRDADISIDTVLVNDFPHKPHVKSVHKLFSRANCFVCHKVLSDGPHDFNATVETLPDAAGCKKCHEAHQYVGLVLGGNRPTDTKGDCVLCHLAGDPAWFGPDGKPGAPVTKRWPRNGAFKHSSSGHKDVACETCHDEMNRAQDLASVWIPTEDHKSCGPCHLKARFHWK